MFRDDYDKKVVNNAITTKCNNVSKKLWKEETELLAKKQTESCSKAKKEFCNSKIGKPRKKK